jgi:hypothetical protein
VKTLPLLATLLCATLLCACPAAAAQQVAVRHAEHGKHAQGYAHGYVRAARPIVIPQQTAPSQEAFASLPDREPAVVAVPSDCDTQLAKIAVVRPLGGLVAPGECGAPDAVEMTGVILSDATKIAITPPATLRCTMATAVAQWVREDIAPAATKIVGSRLRVLENMGSYECRGRDRVRGATLSEHGRANALDVHAFKFADGARLVLADLNASKEFRDAVRMSACARFNTVLGPGSDEDHAEHVHVDLEERRNNYKICEWDVIVPIAQAKAKAEPEGQAQAASAVQAEAAAIPLDQVPLPLPRPVMASAGRRFK